MNPQPLIAVSDVRASSRWYQAVLNFKSGHGGADYEQLIFNDQSCSSTVGMLISIRTLGVRGHGLTVTVSYSGSKPI